MFYARVNREEIGATTAGGRSRKTLRRPVGATQTDLGGQQPCDSRVSGLDKCKTRNRSPITKQKYDQCSLTSWKPKNENCYECPPLSDILNIIVFRIGVVRFKLIILI